MSARLPEKTKTAIRCENCGAIYAGYVRPDGTVRSLGRSPCSCGDMAYAAIDATDLGL